MDCPQFPLQSRYRVIVGDVDSAGGTVGYFFGPASSNVLDPATFAQANSQQGWVILAASMLYASKVAGSVVWPCYQQNNARVDRNGTREQTGRVYLSAVLATNNNIIPLIGGFSYEVDTKQPLQGYPRPLYIEPPNEFGVIITNAPATLIQFRLLVYVAPLGEDVSMFL